jgi:PAS domain S-box-containing protein
MLTMPAEHLQFYRDAFMHIDEGFALCEMLFDDAGQPFDYRFLDVNPACGQTTGLASETVIGRTARELIPSLDQFWVEMFGRVVRTGQPARFQHYVLPRDKWFSTFGFSLGGDIFGALVTDISTRKRTEHALSESEARYRALAHSTSDTLYRMSADASTLLEVFSPNNPQRGEWPSRTWLSDYVHPDDRDATMTAFAEAVQTKTPFVQEHRARRSDGTWSWVLSRAVPVFDSDGLIAEWVGSAIDISDRKRAEEHNDVIGQYAAALASALTAREVTDIMQETAARTMGAGLTSVYRIVDDGRFIERITDPEDTSRLGGHTRLPIDQNLMIASAFKRRQPVCIESQEELLESYPHIAELIRSEDMQAFGCFPFFGKSHAVTGALYVVLTGERSTFSLPERNLLFACAQIGGQALERAILSEQAKEVAAVQERHRIARDLHDAVNQVLFASTMYAEALPRTWERDSETARSIVAKVIGLNRAAMAEMRKLLLELRPEAIVQTPLPRLLQQLAHAVQGVDDIEAELQFDGPDDLILPEETHIAVYRIAQEAMTNVIRHSQAQHATIQFDGTGAPMQMTIADDGRGFDQSRALARLGMRSMRERAERIGAALNIVSAPEQGTRISVTIPE